MTDFDSLGVCILQTACQRLRHVKNTLAMVAFRRFVDNFKAVFVHLMFIGQDCPCDLICIANGVRFFGIQGKIMAFDQLRRNLTDSEAFQKRDQFEVDMNGGSKDDSFGRGGYGIFDLVWPDVIDRLLGPLAENPSPSQILTYHCM